MSVSNTEGFRLVKRPGRAPAVEPMGMPSPGPGEAVVRVRAVGLCRTDLLVADGTVPIGGPVVLGHEFSGDLVACDGRRDILEGALVAVDPTFPLPDGTDGFMGLDRDGCIATWATVPAERLIRSPRLSYDQAAYMEPVAAAMGGLPAAREAGGRGLVLGDNRIAGLTARVFAEPGDGVPPPAFERMSHDEFAERTARDDGLNRYDWILETRLSDDLFRQALRALRPGGRLIAKSRHLPEATLPVRAWVLKRLSLVGRTRSGMDEAHAWIGRNQAFVDGLVGRSYHLEDWSQAFALANGGEGRKIFINP